MLCYFLSYSQSRKIKTAAAEKLVRRCVICRDSNLVFIFKKNTGAWPFKRNVCGFIFSIFEDNLYIVRVSAAAYLTRLSSIMFRNFRFPNTSRERERDNNILRLQRGLLAPADFTKKNSLFKRFECFLVILSCWCVALMANISII